jgi:hypothetical protein
MDLASMVEGSFSLDWLVELTGLEASHILSVLEEQAQKGVMTKVKPATYLFEKHSHLLFTNRKHKKKIARALH